MAIDLETRYGSPQTIHVLFPTLLGATEFPGAAALNAELAAYIRSREQQERDHSPFTTVNQGWQSGLDFFHADVPAINTLKQFINHQIECFLAEWGRVSFSPGAPKAFHYDYTGWAIILRQGGFQHEHVHTKTDLIGVYYVEVPTLPAEAPPGDLTLLDPRGGRTAARAVWENAQFTIRPRAGHLVLFPSFLPHRVDQVQASGERISINFDVTLQGLS